MRSSPRRCWPCRGAVRSASPPPRPWSAFSLLAAPLTGRAETDVYRPLAAAGDAVDQLRLGLDAGRREATAEAQRAAARGAYALDPRTLALLQTGTVAVDPWEASAAWAYDLDWRPLPVFQDYAAYTPQLDQLNAAALATADGPDLILRHLTTSGRATDSIDGRYAPFDVPATTRELICRFRAVRTTDRFQVLERAPDRCGPEVQVGTVEGRYNEPIDVPRVGPDELLFARIEGLEPRGIGKLRTAVYKDVRRLIAVDDRVYRLVGPNAAGGLLLSAPPRLDFPAPFALAPNPATITLGSRRRFRCGARLLRGGILQGTGQPMILYGCAVTDGDVFARCAEAGIRRLRGDAGGELLAQPSAGSIASQLQPAPRPGRRARRPRGAGAAPPGRRDRRPAVRRRPSARRSPTPTSRSPAAPGRSASAASPGGRARSPGPR